MVEISDIKATIEAEDLSCENQLLRERPAHMGRH